MEIRKAIFNDTNGIKKLLGQVLNIHVDGRPDLFIPNTTKYTDLEIMEIMSNPNTPIFVAVEEDEVIGYVFGILQDTVGSNNMKDHRTLYIDDFCVEESRRNEKIGEQLFEYVQTYAKEVGCYNITLNVWAFNQMAQSFYTKLGFLPMKYVLEKIL